MKGIRFTLFLVLGILVAAIAPGRAAAQMGMGSTGAEMQVPISPRSVESYARLLQMDADQKAAATVLHEGYMAGVKSVRQDTSKMMKEMQEEFMSGMDPSALKDVAKKFEPMTKRMEDLEKQFFADLRSLLSEEQDARYPRIERHRKRETNLKFSMVAGARVDLLDVAERLKLASAGEEIDGILLDYELDLDRALTTRESTMRDLQKDGEKIAEQGMMFDPSAITTMFKKMVEADIPLRELNKTYARRMTPLLPPDRQGGFEQEFRVRAFPQVYREPHAFKELEAALKFTDLTAEQREQISDLKGSYERELDAANKRWAASIEEKDDKGIVSFMAFMGGGGQDNPTAEPRKARRELDRRTRDRLHTVLTGEQKERLPKEPKRSPQQDALEMMGMDVDADLMMQWEEMDPGGN